MPNHVTNIIKMHGSDEDIQAIKDFMQKPEPGDNEREPENTFNFHQIARTPKDLLARTSPFRAENGETDAEAAKIKDKYIKLYGACEWYDWQVTNWGTKWDAYEISWNGDSVSFQTAWSTPEPIFRKLAAKFPKVKFFIAYADEDTGSNCGFLVVENDKFSWLDASRTDEADLYAMIIQGSEVESIEDLAEYNGYDSVKEMIEDYDEDYVENLKNSLKMDTPLIDLGKSMTDFNVPGEEISKLIELGEINSKIKLLKQ